MKGSLNLEQIVHLQPDTVAEIFGMLDFNAKKIEKTFNVTLLNRADGIKITGLESNVLLASRAIVSLSALVNKGEAITEQSLNYVCDSIQNGNEASFKYMDSDCILITSKGKPVKPKTEGQREYIEAIKKNTVTIAIGPAGTGKTYLAVALAVKALKNKEVTKIIITRPAVEAGEKLGFLPGDLQEKVDPYLRPLNDALMDMLGSESYQRYQERGDIEVAPLAYMRGRTLDDSFIILDEAQNTTPEQMKMFVTRFGYSSKVVITGDITQTDLPVYTRSGLKEATKVLDGIEGISIKYLTAKDVVRHPLVQKIIDAYDKFEKAKQMKDEKKGKK